MLGRRVICANKLSSFRTSPSEKCLRIFFFSLFYLSSLRVNYVYYVKGILALISNQNDKVRAQFVAYVKIIQTEKKKY